MVDDLINMVTLVEYYNNRVGLNIHYVECPNVLRTIHLVRIVHIADFEIDFYINIDKRRIVYVVRIDYDFLMSSHMTFWDTLVEAYKRVKKC